MAIRNYPEYKSNRPDYIYVEDVDKLVDTLLERDNKIIAVDTETHYDATLTGAISRFIAGVPNNSPFCVTLYDGTFGYYISKDIGKLERLFQNSDAKFVFHNHKYDRHMLANIGIDLDIEQISDTMVMIHLIDEEFMCKTPNGEMVRSKKLKDLAYHFLGDDAHELEDMVAEYRAIKALHNKAEGGTGGKVNVSYKEVEELNRDLMKDYACADVEFTYKLYNIFVKDIIKQDLKAAYRLDMYASDAVYKIERRGIKVDLDYYNQLYTDYAGELGRIDALINNIVDVDGEFGGGFSVDSSNDIVKAFEKLGVIWAWKTDKKDFRTDKKVLEQLLKIESNKAIPQLASLILERRDIQKVRDTFIKNMLDYCQADGRVHPDFNVCPNDFNTGSTRTGRLSSSNPNLQNIPKEDTRTRKGIIPEDGYVLVEIDAAQQEYRMLGHYSNDEQFMKLIHDGIDVHIGTTMLMLDMDYETASIKHNRQIGKRLNFALVYGLGLSALCVSLGYKLDEPLYNKAQFILMKDKVPYEKMKDIEYIKQHYKDDVAVQYYCSTEAQEAIKKAADMKAKYFSQFPQIQAFLNSVKIKCREYGYIKTWGKRKRHFKNPSKDAYKAPNALIQGSCGDILKAKLAELEKFLADKKTRIINTVHDSILFEVEIEEGRAGIVDELIDILRDLPFRVPMDWEAEGSDKSWADITDMDKLDILKGE